MSAFPEYPRYDATGLAELMRRRQVTALELVEAAIERIEAHNPRLNAVIYPLYDAARQAAQGPLPNGPFQGVPFLLKDLMSSYAGAPTSHGTRLLRHLPAPIDTELVRRFKQAGLIIVGKTNTPELGLTPYTEPEAFGPTHNPWDLGRTPGGSSGGSAAAVAARLVPMASGGDGGGSIRIPASCCGLFGLKPSRGRNPTGPVLGEVWNGFAVEHVLTRSVRDSAAMLDATAGADPGAPYAAPPQERPYLLEVNTDPGKLRIAFTSQPFLGHSVAPQCEQALQQTVALLTDLGHQVEEAAPLVNREEFALSFVILLAAETRADIEWFCSLVQRSPSAADWEAVTYGLGILGKALSARDYIKADRTLQMAAREIGRFFNDYDVLLTPTLAMPPFPIGALQPTAGQKALLRLLGTLDAGWLMLGLRLAEKLSQEIFEFIPYTPVFNVTGQPAMSVPLAWTEEGLPIGMHFVGRFGDEATLFRLAGQLERARPWADRYPPGFGLEEPDTAPA